MSSKTKVALVTGSSQRIGAQIVRNLHKNGMDVAIHYRNSEEQATHLKNELNQIRPASAMAFSADFNHLDEVEILAEQVIEHFGRLDALVNNASILEYESNTSMGKEQYQALVNLHIGAPYYLTRAVANSLKESRGCVVNIVDIYAQRPPTSLALYSATKAGLVSMTKSFALDLAPEVRVNAVAPGAIQLPNDSANWDLILERTPLERLGSADEIAEAVKYLIFDATFTTGHVLTVDGGRAINTP